MLADHNQIDKTATLRKPNRSAALGWPAMKLLGGGGASTSLRSTNGSIPGLATYFRFSFRFFKKGSCQLLAKVCARSTG